MLHSSYQVMLLAGPTLDISQRHEFNAPKETGESKVERWTMDYQASIPTLCTHVNFKSTAVAMSCRLSSKPETLQAGWRQQESSLSCSLRSFQVIMIWERCNSLCGLLLTVPALRTSNGGCGCGGWTFRGVMRGLFHGSKLQAKDML